MLDLTVIENAELGLKFRGFSRKARRAMVRPWLERLGVAHLEKNRARFLPEEKSKGWFWPGTGPGAGGYFLDEPFSNLDKEIRKELIIETGKLLAEGIQQQFWLLITGRKLMPCQTPYIIWKMAKLRDLKKQPRSENRQAEGRKEW